MSNLRDLSIRWIMVENLQGGKFIIEYGGNVVLDSIGVTDEEWIGYSASFMEWPIASRVVFGDTVHEPRDWQVFYVHPECHDAQLDALVCGGE